MPPSEPALRVATLDDEAAVETLMKESAADRTLLEDGTYYALESGGELVACGGWSRRGKLYTGSGDAADDGRLLDPATEPTRVRARFVRADWTRRGLGRRIIDECEAAARREGFAQLALVATLPGLPLYLACGFKRLEDVDVVLPDGVVLAGVVMQKPIP